MTRDPIRRRFGKGAARLRVGLPPEAEPLSAVARTPIRLERRLTVVPFVTAVLIAWLLVTSPGEKTFEVRPEPEAIQVVLEAWPVPRPPELAKPEPEAPKLEPTRRRPVPRSPESLALRRTPKSPAPPTGPTAAPAEAKPFDPTALATRGARWSAAEAMAAEKASAAQLREAAASAVGGSASRLAHDDSPRPLPTDVAQASRTARTVSLPGPLDASAGTPSAKPLAARPGA
ncbi:hypothetical protein K2X89_08800, partial [Myxococcota bacterium]|nr:hypothetical protein [Myxococcota bacterium]